MRHDLPDGPLMHPSKRSPGKPAPDPLAKEHEYEDEQIVGKQDTTKNASNNDSIAILSHPVQELFSEPKRNQLLANAHGYEHLGDVRVVGVDGIGEGASEEEI